MIAYPGENFHPGNRMTKRAIAENLAGRLFAAEAAIDAALTETASLMAALPMARAEAQLSAVTGQRAFDGVAASLGALTAARAHLVRTHHTLAAIAQAMSLDDLAVGPLDKPEDTPPLGGRLAPLIAPLTPSQVLKTW